MSRLPILATTTLLAVATGSCVANRAYETPWLQTHIVDSGTHAPIANVVVTVSSLDNPTKKATGRSLSDGSVAIHEPPEKRWTLLPWDTFPPSGKAKFESPAYQTLEIDLRAGINDLPTVELARIK